MEWNTSRMMKKKWNLNPGVLQKGRQWHIKQVVVIVNTISSLTSLTKPFCNSASWSFSARFWVRARLIVALSDWTSSNMRRRSSASWVWLSTWRSNSPRRVSCSAHRRLSCSLSLSWGKHYRRWLTHFKPKRCNESTNYLWNIQEGKKCLEKTVKHTWAWYCTVMASFSCCRLLRASCKATSFSDGPEDWGSVPRWASLSWDNNAKKQTEKKPNTFFRLTHITKEKYYSCATYMWPVFWMLHVKLFYCAQLRVTIIFYKVCKQL